MLRDIRYLLSPVANAKRQRKKEGHRARLEAARAAARREQRKRRAIGIVIAAAAIVGVLALISAVGGDDSGDDDQAATTTTTASTTTTTLPPNPDEPAVGIPDGPPPTELLVTDVKVGDGPEAKLGDTIEVHYVGVQFDTKEEFESSWDQRSPATFELVEGGLIKGWTDGIPGMKVGGRRRLVIPSADAYGDNPEGGRPAGSLVFVIDLLAIK